VTCAISWDRCSLIGLLVVMSIVVVLVLLLFSVPADWGGDCVCSLVLCSLFWIGCFLSNSAIMKPDLLCYVITVCMDFSYGNVQEIDFVVLFLF